MQVINRGIFWGFFYVLHSTLLHLLPLRFHWIEPRNVALAIRRSNHSARSHPRTVSYYARFLLFLLEVKCVRWPFCKKLYRESLNNLSVELRCMLVLSFSK
jgi:hypothetical protein